MENLGPQFGPKKTRWTPDKGGTDIAWHILGEHRGGGKSPSKYDFDAWHAIHMRLHAEGIFAEGQEHEHFTPKQWKKKK